MQTERLLEFDSNCFKCSVSHDLLKFCNRDVASIVEQNERDCEVVFLTSPFKIKIFETFLSLKPLFNDHIGFGAVKMIVFG